jgi:hypothetical protein
MNPLGNVANLKPWKPGETGNPHGRPIGSRQAFSQGFMRDLALVWGECGTIRHVAQKNKELFFGVCARLIPQDVQVSLVEHQGGLTPNDIAILHGIRQAIPDANSQSPTRVLEYVRDTLRAASATIVASTLIST